MVISIILLLFQVAAAVAYLMIYIIRNTLIEPRWRYSLFAAFFEAGMDYIFIPIIYVTLVGIWITHIYEKNDKVGEIAKVGWVFILSQIVLLILSYVIDYRIQPRVIFSIPYMVNSMLLWILAIRKSK